MELKKAPPPVSEINVTPMVDVMLVVLIIFMDGLGVARKVPRAEQTSNSSAAFAAYNEGAPRALALARESAGDVVLQVVGFRP